MPDFNEPFGSSVFCDDIRQEVGGKASYMGVYIGSMYVTSFPVTLPKFCIAVVLTEPFEMARKRDWAVSLAVYAPGNDTALMTAQLPPVPPDAFNIMSEVPDDPDVPKLSLASIAFGIAPFVIPQAGRVKVRATYQDGLILKLGSLKIERPPAAPTILPIT